jgi:hypothetical protein
MMTADGGFIEPAVGQVKNPVDLNRYPVATYRNKRLTVKLSVTD